MSEGISLPESIHTNSVDEVSVRDEAPSLEKFKVYDNASSQLSGEIKEKLEAAGVNERYFQASSVYVNPEVLKVGENANLQEILQAAKEQDQEVVLYMGGINWRGPEIIDASELLGTPDKPTGRSLVSLSSELSSDISHDMSIPVEKKDEEVPSAMNFLAEANKAVVITLDPVYRENEIPATSLRSDAISRQTILRKFQENEVRAEAISWSDGGFKDIQVQFAGYLAIVDELRYARERYLVSKDRLEIILDKLEQDPKDVGALRAISSLLIRVQTERGNIQSLGHVPKEKAHIKQHLEVPVFLSGNEALRYFETHRDIDTIRGGAPSVPEELAHPFHSTDKNFIKRGPLRALGNWFVKLAGTNESNKTLDLILHNKLPKENKQQQGNALVILRLLELGRGIGGRDDISEDELNCRLARAAIVAARGNSVDISLLDTSGAVVNTASQENATPTLSKLINGNKSLVVETRDDEKLPSVHIEVKRAIPELEQFAAAAKLGLISEETTESVNSRWIPVNLEVEGQHQNGSYLHKPRILDAERFQFMKANKTNPDTNEPLSEREIELLEVTANLFNTE